MERVVRGKVLRPERRKWDCCGRNGYVKMCNGEGCLCEPPKRPNSPVLHAAFLRAQECGTHD